MNKDNKNKLVVKQIKSEKKSEHFRLTVDGTFHKSNKVKDSVIKQVVFESLKSLGFDAGHIRIVRVK